MKIWKLTMFLLVAALVMAGCGDDSVTIFDPVPAAPQNIQSITADGEIYIYFNGLYERDIDEYWIYRSAQEFDGYEHIGTVLAESNPYGDTLFYYEFIDPDVINGVTYYYSVAAVDMAGQVSELSAETIWDTPRPEGYANIFYDNDNPQSAGFNFASQTVVNSRSVAADIWLGYLVDSIGTTRYINVGDTLTDIQDMGYTSDFDEISFSPEFGWSELGYFELIEGHTYVIWTFDDHYAKVRVESINPSGYVVLRWGYQVDEGNLQLAPRPEHDEEFLRDTRTMSLLR